MEKYLCDATKLRDLMRARKYTRNNALAQDADVHERTLRRMLHGERVTRESLEAVAAALETDWEEIAFTEGPPQPTDAPASTPERDRRRRLGIMLAPVLLVAVAGGLVFNVSRTPLPEADTDQFAVAIAQLENDERGEYQDLIASALLDFEGIQLLRFDTTIPLESAKPDLAGAHERARSYLEDSGVELVVWGTVLRHEGDSLAKLYWTASEDLQLQGSGGRYHPTDDLQLPPTFWSDLSDVLRLIVMTYDTEFHAIEGAFVADRLGPFVQKVRALLADSGSLGAQPRTLSDFRMVLARSLVTLGRQAGQVDALEEATGIYRQVLKDLAARRDESRWASVQNDLGVALRELGEQEPGTVRLEESLAAHQQALTVFTRETAPEDWATTQNHLGKSLWNLGWRDSSPLGASRLEESLQAHRRAAEVFERDRFPLHWAQTQDNLGTSFVALSWRESEASAMKLLESAEGSFRRALQEYSQERVPMSWALVKNHLGVTLWTIGDRQARGVEQLAEAVATYREALREWTRARTPLKWAMTQNNLGIALWTLGERESGTDRLKEAVAAFEAALLEYHRERAPADWATTHLNRGIALRALGQRETDTIRLEQSVRAFHEALKEWDRGRDTMNWAKVQGSLCNALAIIGDRESSTAKLQEALRTCGGALEEFSPEETPLYWAETESNRGNALRWIGRLEHDFEQSCEALGAHLSAWEAFEAAAARFYSNRVGEEVAIDLRILNEEFDAIQRESCLEQHRPLLESLSLSSSRTSSSEGPPG